MGARAHPRPRSRAGLQEHHEGWTLGQPTAGRARADRRATSPPARARGWLSDRGGREPARGPDRKPARPGPGTGAANGADPQSATPAGRPCTPAANPPAVNSPAPGTPAAAAQPHRPARTGHGRGARWPPPGRPVGDGLLPGRHLLLAAGPAVHLPPRGKQSIFVLPHAALASNLTLTATLFAIWAASWLACRAWTAPRSPCSSWGRCCLRSGSRCSLRDPRGQLGQPGRFLRGPRLDLLAACGNPSSRARGTAPVLRGEYPATTPRTTPHAARGLRLPHGQIAGAVVVAALVRTGHRLRRPDDCDPSRGLRRGPPEAGQRPAPRAHRGRAAPTAALLLLVVAGLALPAGTGGRWGCSPCRWPR